MYPLNELRETHFTLWAPGVELKAVNLILATVQDGSPIRVNRVTEEGIPLKLAALGLWTVPAAEAKLKKDTVYFYWFQVIDETRSITVTDPFATNVDWRVLSTPTAPPKYDFITADEEYYPAGTISWNGTTLQVADSVPEDFAPPLLAITSYPEQTLPSNRQLVIYELPPAWVRPNKPGSRDESIGTFNDVVSLLTGEITNTFPDLQVLELKEQSYLDSIGVNAIEFLPLADSVYPRQWAYGTTNFNAPDYELGFPETYNHAAPNRDLARVVTNMHNKGIRLITDVVMGFAKRSPFRSYAYDSFFINNPNDTPEWDGDRWNSRSPHENRNGYGADLWRYSKPVTAYSPLTGKVESIYPGRQFLLTCQERWMRDFQVGGFRLDSCENVANWDFIQQFNEAGLRHHLAREGATADGYLCVGEELAEYRDLFRTGRLTGIWREQYKYRMKKIIFGEGDGGSFEDYVQKTIDCKRDGYPSLTNAVIYLTSHDVEGPANERIYRHCVYRGLKDDAVAFRRVRLAFACLLTSVGMPMILAGDEFADDHDLFDINGNITQSGGKQVDPINFNRLAGAKGRGRRAVKDYVANLIRLRTRHPALASDDVDFFYSNFDYGRRIFAWRRGTKEDPVVVLANFSDWMSPNGEDYEVPNWPYVEGRRWREAGMDRLVDKPGRESIYEWEAKVYYLEEEK